MGGLGDISTLPNSSLSIVGSGSLGLLNLLSSTRLGRSCFMSSSILATAFSRPSFVVLVTWRYNGGFCINHYRQHHRLIRRWQEGVLSYLWRSHAFIWVVCASCRNIFTSKPISSCFHKTHIYRRGRTVNLVPAPVSSLIYSRHG